MLGGDLIVAIDGQQVTDPQDISALMDKHQAGDAISITVLRGKRQITLKFCSAKPAAIIPEQGSRISS